MIKNIVGDVRKLIHAGADCLHTVRKYYAFQNSLSEGEREYGQLNLEKIKLHIELDKTELARRKNMLAEEGAKKHGVAALQDMLDRKEATTEPTLFVNKEELEQLSDYANDKEFEGTEAEQKRKHKALVAEMASVRRLTNAADNVSTVDQVRAVMDREILAQARERQLITDKLKLSKKLRAVERANADLAERVTSAVERDNDLTEELAELHSTKATNTASIERLIADLQLEHSNATRAEEEAEEAAARAERWESKSKEWYDALEAERKTVASLLEANKEILSLTGARSHETPVVAVERILNRMAEMASVERERR